MVVPAIRIVIGDYDGCVLPFRRVLKKINYLYQERLLIERIGITGMPILIGGQPLENSPRENFRL